MANPALAKLKAFIRLDYSGRIVPGQVILRKRKPKIGRWLEISSSECCNPVPAPTLVSLAVVADPASIEIGATTTFTVTGAYSDDSTQDLSATATLASSDETILTIAAAVGTGVAEGTSDVSATVGDVTSPAVTVTVTTPA